MHRLVPLPLVGVLLALSSAPARGAEPGLDARTRDFDQLHLEIRVTPDLAAGRVDGRVTVAFEPLVDGLRTLRLHSEDTRVLAVVDGDARPLTWTQSKGVLAIELARAAGKGQGAEVTIAYRSTPRRGLFFHGPSDHHPDVPLLLYSQGQGNDNRHWIPCYDLPDDRFAWDLHVTVPDGLHTVSNGVLVGQDATEGGQRVDHWRFEDRCPSYLVSLVVAKLETQRATWRDVTLEYSAVPGYAHEVRTALVDTPRMMEFFSTYLDAPYPWARYAQTFVWDFVYGGMENVTATTLNMRALHGPAARPNYTADGLVAHELAHMWFGDLLTCRTWDGIWLNEGFATYLTDLYFEHRDGIEEFRLRRRRQNRGYMEGTPNPGALGLERHPRGDRPLELFGGKQYSRGAAILHMLRLELGDDVFRRAVQAYVKRFRDRAVTSEGLRRTVEAVAGQDLAWFWDQWVYGAGYPVLDVRWEGKARRLDVRQAQPRKGSQGLFRLSLPVRLGPQGAVVELPLWGENHAFVLPGATDAPYVRVGVGGDLLARVRFTQTRAAWEQMLARDGDVTARLDAAEALEPHGPLAVPALSRALVQDPSWAVRQTCAQVLERMSGIASATQALLAHTADADPRVREAVFEALGGRRRDAVSGVLQRAVREETHDYPRAAAARSLGRVKAGGAYEALLELLKVDSHGDVVRAGALDGLRAFGDPRAAGIARTYTDYAWGKGGTQRVRKAALDCVTGLAPDAPETHALLVALLDDRHHRMRQWAAEACGTYELRQARRRLESLAKDDWNGGVRAAAKKALEGL